MNKYYFELNNITYDIRNIISNCQDIFDSLPIEYKKPKLYSKIMSYTKYTDEYDNLTSKESDEETVKRFKKAKKQLNSLYDELIEYINKLNKRIKFINNVQMINNKIDEYEKRVKEKEEEKERIKKDALEKEIEMYALDEFEAEIAREGEWEPSQFEIDEMDEESFYYEDDDSSLH